MLITIIIATAVVGMISFIGALVLFRRQYSKEFLRVLVSIAAGSLLAVSFLDLLPEAIESGSYEPHVISLTILLSILGFFIFERIVHWHHCIDDFHPEHELHSGKNIIYLNLFGDAVHNLVDGFLIASAFLLDFQTGIFITIAVILHEIPQEISDFGVLLYAGLTKAKALLYNFVVALTAVGGGVLFYFFGSASEAVIPIMIAVAVGNFVYLATADLIPELHHERNRRKIVWHSAWLLFGVALIYAATIVFPHEHVAEDEHAAEASAPEESVGAVEGIYYHDYFISLDQLVRLDAHGNCTVPHWHARQRTVIALNGERVEEPHSDCGFGPIDEVEVTAVAAPPEDNTDTK